MKYVFQVLLINLYIMLFDMTKMGPTIEDSYFFYFCWTVFSHGSS